MYKPTANYTLALVDNNRSSYIDTSKSLASKAEAYVAVSDSGKGNSSARRVLVGADLAIPGSLVPLSFRLTIVVPTGATEAVSDTVIEDQSALMLKVLTNYSDSGGTLTCSIDDFQSAIKNAIKGVLTLD
jgi:hypothetical protein